ncbi:MAG TPA: hypothetical protein PK854_01745 [Oscillospiraceae bacterium]|nr:hypothetical protein [Oscillospiraceae bacterium]HPS33973.1 hypothetical protein [Oscillospiraceae bacterium]
MKKIVVLTLILFLIVLILACSSGIYSGSPKRGTVADGVYTNDYFKLSFTIPEKWGVYSDEEVYKNFNISLPTDEDLTNSKTGFTDVCFYKTVDQKNRISITYSYETEGNITDEQIKNRLSAKTSEVTFRDIEYIKIGDADYAMISGLSSDGTLSYYYLWDLEVCGNLRPTISIHLDSGDSINDILKNFTQAID